MNARLGLCADAGCDAIERVYMRENPVFAATAACT